MRVLVTGANGYLGQGVVKQLLEDGIEVIASDFEGKYLDKRADFVEGNIFEIENPFEHYKEPDVLLHLAWRDGFVHNSLSHIDDLPKHYHFVKKCIEGGVKHVSVLGSMHEVGFYEGSICDNTPTNPLSLYGVSKDALRRACELLTKQNDVNLQWIRGFYIVGNSEFGCSIFSKITEAAKNEKKVFPFTLGLNQFDFIDYEEFCTDVAAVVEQDTINGIINVCSGRPERLADRVERFIQENGYDIKLQYGAFPDRPYDSKAIWGDDRKIKEILSNRKISNN